MKDIILKWFGDDYFEGLMTIRKVTPVCIIFNVFKFIKRISLPAIVVLIVSKVKATLDQNSGIISLRGSMVGGTILGQCGSA